MAIPANIQIIVTGIGQGSRARVKGPGRGGSEIALPATFTGSILTITEYLFQVLNVSPATSGSAQNYINISTNGITIKSMSIGRYQNIIGFRILRSDLAKAYPTIAAVTAPATGTNTTGKPRYKVISPTQNGYYTEAVRELNEAQIASMKSRGFKIDQVGGGFALQAAVRIPVLTHATPPASRKSRRGFVEGNYYNRSLATIAKSVIHRSERKPRLLFAENQSMFMVDMYAVKVTKNGQLVGLIQPVGIDQARKLRTYYNTKPGYKTALSRVSSTTGKTTRTVTPTSNVKNTGNTGYTPPAPIIGGDANLQRITQELKNLKAWIESINQRTSDQLIALGGATGDRQSQIDASNDRFEALNARISDQLIALGNAASDNAKAIAAQQAQRLLDDVKKTGGGGLSGLTSIFTGEYSSYALLGIVAVVLLVMLKK